MVRLALILLCVCFAMNGNTAAQETSPADFDGDGEVNFSDFLIFARGFGKTDQDADFDARLDLNDNGAVDFQDFLLFARQFSGSTPPEDATKEPFDPPRIYVADQLADRVFVVDTETNMFDPGLSVTIRQPRSVAYSYLNRRFYVAGLDSFYALTESSEIDYQLPLLDMPEVSDGHPEARGGSRMVLSPDQQLAYLTEDAAVQVEVIHLKNAESAALIPLSRQPSGIAIKPDGSTIYVGHANDPWISVIDGPRRTLADSIQLDGRANGRVVVSPEGESIYTAITLGAPDPSVQIVSIDPETKEVIERMEIAPDSTTIVNELKASKGGGKLYATVRREFIAPNEPLGIAVDSFFLTIDRKSFELTSEIPIRRSDAVSFGVIRDGRTAYVATLDFSIFVWQLVVLDLENDANLGAAPVSFFTPWDVNVYGGKAALGRAYFPEITVF
ncbi:MAG: dockerin type I domain-containing protein [Gemmatimonadota bacterium]|nr:dockerin type I domain-containing protein [Gemmatimonadota bacterium]